MGGLLERHIVLGTSLSELVRRVFAVLIAKSIKNALGVLVELMARIEVLHTLWVD